MLHYRLAIIGEEETAEWARYMRVHFFLSKEKVSLKVATYRSVNAHLCTDAERSI